MIEQSEPTWNATIYMAGDILHAGQLIQRYAISAGMCVTLTAQSFIYTGGREEGFAVGFINYPRFPSGFDDITAKAKALAAVLMVELGQHSYSIVTPKETIWVSRRDDASEIRDDYQRSLEAAKRRQEAAE